MWATYVGVFSQGSHRGSLHQSLSTWLPARAKWKDLIAEGTIDFACTI